VSCWDRSQRAGAFLATGITMNLVSPISWIHHLVWLSLAVAVFFRESLVRSAAWGWAAAIAFVLLAARLPYAGNAIATSHATGILHAVGAVLRESYVVLNLVVLVLLQRVSMSSSVEHRLTDDGCTVAPVAATAGGRHDRRTAPPRAHRAVGRRRP
jgi:hypothetical protein